MYGAQPDPRRMMCTKSESDLFSSSLGIAVTRKLQAKKGRPPGGHIEYANETKMYGAQVDPRRIIFVKFEWNPSVSFLGIAVTIYFN